MTVPINPVRSLAGLRSRRLRKKEKGERRREKEKEKKGVAGNVVTCRPHHSPESFLGNPSCKGEKKERTLHVDENHGVHSNCNCNCNSNSNDWHKKILTLWTPRGSRIHALYPSLTVARTCRLTAVFQENSTFRVFSLSQQVVFDR